MNATLDWLLNSKMTMGPVVRSPIVITGSPLYFIALAGMWIGSWVWIASDARKRGKSSFWAVFFLFFSWWPISLVWWLWLRPPLVSPQPEVPVYTRWEWILLAGIIVTGLVALAAATMFIDRMVPAH